MYEIYVVTNSINNKKYVGQTCQGVDFRWRQHKSAARSGAPNYFYRAIRKHGEDAFRLEVVEIVETLQQANEAEKKWVLLLSSIDEKNGYNSTYGGDGSMPTDTTCKKISESRKKRFQDPEFKARMSAANLGKHHTEEGCQNIAKALTGNQYRRGIPHDDESKAKISAGLKKAFREGRRRKTGGLRPGTILGPMSAEEKIKRSLGMKKHTRTPEHEANRRAALEKYYERKRLTREVAA